MNRRRVWAGGAVLCLALVSTACDVKVGDDGLSVDFAVGRATDEWKRTYTIQPGGRFEIVNVNGVIHVSPSKDSEVEVLATREVRAESEEASRELLKKAEMREEVAPDRVSIQGPAPQEGERGFRRRHQISIRYEVNVPPGLNLFLKTQNGEVRLENVQGQIVASTTNGGINGKGVSGTMEATTVNGGIQMDLTAVTGDTRLVTVNGGIVLTVAPGVNAELDATVVNGGVVVHDGVPLSGDERTRQRVTGRINKGGPKLVLQTTNGGVRVGAGGEPGA